MGNRACNHGTGTLSSRASRRILPGLIALIMILVNLLLPQKTLAHNGATLASIKLANTRDDLLTYFEVEHAFTPKIVEAVQKGVPTTFTFYVTLYRRSNSLFDKELADIQVKSTIKYNSLKEEYSVLRPWKDETPVITKSFDEAKAWMTDIDNLKVAPLTELVKGDKYQLRIKAELEKVTLPLALHHVFFFVSFWDFETDWYVINFIY